MENGGYGCSISRAALIRPQETGSTALSSTGPAAPAGTSSPSR